jgi:hypothetical protein
MSANALTVSVSDAEIATNFVVKLVQLGFIGLAALLFVLIFLIIWQGRRADKDMGRFRMAFLIVGFLSVIVSAGVQLMPTRATTTITFSPDLQDTPLTTPTIRLLPAGGMVRQEQEFSLASGTTISIRTDQLIRDAQLLRVAASELAQASAQLAASEPPPAAQVRRVDRLSEAVTRNVDSGDFFNAALAARELTQVAEQIAQ